MLVGFKNKLSSKNDNIVVEEDIDCTGSILCLVKGIVAVALTVPMLRTISAIVSSVCIARISKEKRGGSELPPREMLIIIASFFTGKCISSCPKLSKHRNLGRNCNGTRIMLQCIILFLFLALDASHAHYRHHQFMTYSDALPPSSADLRPNRALASFAAIKHDDGTRTRDFDLSEEGSTAKQHHNAETAQIDILKDAECRSLAGGGSLKVSQE